MNKQEFLKLFELDKIYEKYQNHIPYGLSLHDRLSGTPSAVYYLFEEEDKFKILIESIDFSQEIQKFEFNLILDNESIKFNKNEKMNNEIFPFVTFNENFEADLKFIANFLNKILKPKYNLMGSVHIN